MPLVFLLRRSSAQARYVLGGCLSLLAIFQLILVAQAISIEQSQAFGTMANLLPAFLQRGLGNTALLLATFKGLVAFGYFHPVVAVMVAMLAVYLATEPAHDVESGLVDLVLARSVPRRRLITRSLILAATVPVVATVFMRAGTWVGMHAFGAPSSDWPSNEMLWRLQIHLIAVAWCFGGFALAIGAGAERWSTAFTVSALTTVMLYLLDYLAIGWRPARVIAWISPFQYYPAFSLMAGPVPILKNLGVLVTSSLVFSGIAYWRFNRRDL
jgi:ABC-type transport system involved in multi-copper enzyme maturation permease subunit